MQFNTIILCFLLWGFVEFIAILASIIHRITLKQEHQAKKKYMQRLLEYAARGVDFEELTKELYYSFMGDNRLRIILLHSLRYQPAKAFNYIYSKLGCEPMGKIHAHILKRSQYINETERNSTEKSILISKNTFSYLIKEVETWDELWWRKLKMLKRRKMSALMEKNLILLANLFLYIRLQTDLCLGIFVIVNTIGVVMYIILDYECCIVDEKRHDGFLASKKYAKKMSQSFARGIEGTFQLAASLGLIINITTVVVNWLGPVA